MILLLSLLSILFIGQPLQAATCSCASIPLLNALENGSAQPNQWFLNFAYEQHEMNDLVSGSDAVNDETNRQRSATSALVGISYGLNDKWSLSSMMSHVSHKRQVGTGEQEVSEGIGDSVFLVKYSPFKIGLFSRKELAFGSGVKIPSGVPDNRGVSLLSEDMQPGAGAWSFVVWLYGAKSFHASAKTQLFGLVNWSANQQNTRLYKQGNELNVSVGGSYSTDLGLSFTHSFRYRQVAAAQNEGVDIPNTGGVWVDSIPAVQYQLNQSVAFKVDSQIPLLRQLNGALQFTTSQLLKGSVSVVF